MGFTIDLGLLCEKLSALIAQTLETPMAISSLAKRLCSFDTGGEILLNRPKALILHHQPRKPPVVL